MFRIKLSELDVGDCERASGPALAEAVKTVMMNMAAFCLKNKMHLGTHTSSAALRTALLHWCYSTRNFEASSTTSARNGTSADDDNKRQVDSLTKGKGEGKQTPKSDWHTLKQHRCQHLQWTLGGRLLEPGGGASDNSNNKNTTARTKRKVPQRQTVGPGANETVIRNSFNSVVSFTDIENY